MRHDFILGRLLERDRFPPDLGLCGNSAQSSSSGIGTIVGPLHRCITRDAKPLPRRSWHPRFLENARGVSQVTCSLDDLTNDQRNTSRAGWEAGWTA
jgi:hypothetical protein